ncbi:MAG TPA: hypothetical protein GX510_04650 [Firmicutes bacterium]|nr:hypothetical protein [Candidatus Fermentithermobacillaceae bacterium]
MADLDAKAEETGAWLRVRVPALAGPCQSSPFVKYVPRKIVFGPGEGIWFMGGGKVAYSVCRDRVCGRPLLVARML